MKSLMYLILSTVLLCISFSACNTRNQLPEQPNILFAISDDQSFPHTSAYGCSWVKTPAFDQVAQEGLLFMNCYTPNAKCAPSRSAIITGRNSWQLEEAANHWSYFPDSYQSVFEAFAEHTNYFTGYTGKGVAPVIVKDRLLAGKRYSLEKTTPPGRGISNIDYAANFKKFMEQKPEGKPFLFWYGATEPHRGYQYRIGIEKGGKSTDDIEKVPGFWPDNETVRTDMLDYAFEIEYFDTHLGRMISYLDEIGELENTIIFVTSDNGMPFPRSKGIEYEYSNHMPLAVMWPDGIKNPGRVIEDYVSFIDFAPTWLELAGIENVEAAGMQPVQGKSLSPIFTSKKEGQVLPERNYVLLGQERHDVGRPDDVGYPVRSIIKEGMLYIHNFKTDRWPMGNPETGYLNTDGSPTKTEVLTMHRDGSDKSYWDLCFGKRGDEELYDIKEDPECLENLIDDPEYKETAASLKERLFTELKEQGDPRMFGKGYVFDNYLYANKIHQDYYNRYMNGEIKKFNTGWVNRTDYEEPVRFEE